MSTLEDFYPPTAGGLSRDEVKNITRKERSGPVDVVVKKLLDIRTYIQKNQLENSDDVKFKTAVQEARDFFNGLFGKPS